MNNEWLSEKITYISALKNPSDAQKLLLELAKIQYRTPDQEKKLNALIKAFSFFSWSGVRYWILANSNKSF